MIWAEILKAMTNPMMLSPVPMRRAVVQCCNDRFHRGMKRSVTLSIRTCRRGPNGGRRRDLDRATKVVAGDRVVGANHSDFNGRAPPNAQRRGSIEAVAELSCMRNVHNSHRLCLQRVAWRFSRKVFAVMSLRFHALMRAV
jgi:hypothetical protein